MKPLVAILSHSGANDTIARHWPYFLKAEADLLLVGRVNTHCVFPTEAPGRKIYRIDSGTEAHADGANHILRFLDVIRKFLQSPAFADYDVLVVTEYDSIWLGPIPDPPGVPDGIHAYLAGGHEPMRDSRWYSTRFVHTPWMMNRATAEKVFTIGHRLLRANLIEHGFIDRWLGLIMDLYAIPFHQTQTFSSNSLDTAPFMAAARTAVKCGAWYVHGVKTQEQLDTLLAP